MSEDISSKRRRWYAEAEYSPEPHEKPANFGSILQPAFASAFDPNTGLTTHIHISAGSIVQIGDKQTVTVNAGSINIEMHKVSYAFSDFSRQARQSGRRMGNNLHAMTEARKGVRGISPPRTRSWVNEGVDVAPPDTLVHAHALKQKQNKQYPGSDSQFKRRGRSR